MINIIKRNGEKEELNYDKINNVLSWACEGVKNVNPSDVAVNAKLQIQNNIKTEEIHKVLIQSASSLISEETPNYQYVAANLLNYFIRKQIFGVKDNLPSIRTVMENNVNAGVYDIELLNSYTTDEMEKIEKWIKHTRDFNFTYGGLQQLVDKYLIKDRFTGILYETPQFMYMLIAMTLCAKNPNSKEKLDLIKSMYDDFSLHNISLPTPIMAGVRTPSRQYSSCTLIDVGDTLESIAASNTAVLRYTARKAGIGLNVGKIRAIGDRIRGGEVIHTGLIPFLKMYESTVKSCTQNGIRGGSATVYVPFWHKEILDVLVLKNNKGTDDNRVRKLDYNIQFNRLFYKRVVEKGDITLFSPADAPSLYEAFFESNEKFEEIYLKLENNKNIKSKKIKAVELFNSLIQERISTGRIYIMNVDHANSHSSFTDKVYMSNLCCEITLPTKPIQSIDDEDGEIALCVLAAINLGQLKKLSDLESIMENTVRSLDYVIDNQEYPIKAAEKMLKRRSLGIGVTNLAYYLAKNDVKFTDKKALELVDEVMEYIQYYAIKASVKLAKEFGKCEYFNKTKYSQGILPIDTYNKNVDTIVNREYSLDWEALRQEVLTYGMRNSTLTAIMPCESSSVVTNSTNGIEPIRSLVTTKSSKAGLIRVVAPDMTKLKNKYQLAFDINDNKSITNITSVIQKYIDQAISTNHYYDHEKNNEISLQAVGYDLLYAYKMGIKCLYYANTNDGKTDKNDTDVTQSSQVNTTDDLGCEGGACSV